MRGPARLVALAVAVMTCAVAGAQSADELVASVRRTWAGTTPLLRVDLPTASTEIPLSVDGYQLPGDTGRVHLPAHRPVRVREVSGDDRSIRFELSRPDGSGAATVRFRADEPLAGNPTLTTSLFSAIDAVLVRFAVQGEPPEDEEQEEEEEAEEEEEEEDPEPVVDRLLVEASRPQVVGDGSSTVTLTISARDADGQLMPQVEGTVEVRATSGALAADRAELRGGVATVNLTAPRFSDDLVLVQRSIELSVLIVQKMVAGGGGADPQATIQEAVRTLGPTAPEATVDPKDPWVYVVAELEGVKGRTKIEVLKPDVDLAPIRGFYRGRDAAGQPYTLETVPAGDALWAGDLQAGPDTILLRSFGETKGGFEIVYLFDKREFESFQKAFPDFKGLPTALLRFPGDSFYIVAPPIIMRRAQRDAPESEAPPAADAKPTASLVAAANPIAADGESTSQLVFQYLDAAGRPVRGVELEWSVEPQSVLPAAEKGEILRSDPLTDGDGRARALYRAPALRGEATSMQEIGHISNRTVWAKYSAPGDRSHVTAAVGLLRGADLRLKVTKPGVATALLPIRLSSLNGTISGRIELRTSPVEAEVEADYPLEHAEVTLDGPADMLRWVAFDGDTTDSKGRFTVKLLMKNWPRWDLKVDAPFVVRPDPDFIHAQRLALNHARAWPMPEIEQVDLKIFVKDAQRRLAELEPEEAAGLMDRLRLVAWTLQILKDSRKDAGEALGEMVNHGKSFFSAVAGYCYSGFHLDRWVNQRYKILETKVGLRNLKLIKARLLKSIGSGGTLSSSLTAQLGRYLLQSTPPAGETLRAGLTARVTLREGVLPLIVKQVAEALASYLPNMPLTLTDMAGWVWLDPYVVRGNQLVRHLIVNDDLAATHRTSASCEARLSVRKNAMVREYLRVTEWRIASTWVHFLIDTASECTQVALKITAVAFASPQLLETANKVESLNKAINTAAAAIEAFVEWWRLSSILESNEQLLVEVLSDATATRVAALAPLTDIEVVAAGWAWGDGLSGPPDLMAALALDECELSGGTVSADCLAGLVTGGQLADAWIVEQLGPLTSLVTADPEVARRLADADELWRGELLAAKLAAVAIAEQVPGASPETFAARLEALGAATAALDTELESTTKRMRQLPRPVAPFAEPPSTSAGVSGLVWGLGLGGLLVLVLVVGGLAVRRIRRAPSGGRADARGATTPVAPAMPVTPPPVVAPPVVAPQVTPPPVVAPPVVAPPPPAPRPPALLDALGTSHSLGAPCTTLGSADDNDLVLQVEGVSRHHARIWTEPDGSCWIEDLGSTNGIWLDGQKVEKAWLADGSQLTLGAWQATYRAASGQRERI